MIHVLVSLLLLMEQNRIPMDQTPDLEALRWQSRVILIFAAEPGDKHLQQQAKALQSRQTDLDERDLKVFALIGPSQANEAMRKQFGVTGKNFGVVLIGKDGTRKLRKLEPVHPEEIFRLIDTMPMRHEEMRQQRK